MDMREFQLNWSRWAVLLKKKPGWPVPLTTLFKEGLGPDRGGLKFVLNRTDSARPDKRPVCVLKVDGAGYLYLKTRLDLGPNSGWTVLGLLEVPDEAVDSDHGPEKDQP